MKFDRFTIKAREGLAQALRDAEQSGAPELCPEHVLAALARQPDGVVRAPSEFSRTTGSPASMTAIQELVVPKSIPKILLIVLLVCGFGEDHDHASLGQLSVRD